MRSPRLRLPRRASLEPLVWLSQRAAAKTTAAIDDRGQRGAGINKPVCKAQVPAIPREAVRRGRSQDRRGSALRRQVGAGLEHGSAGEWGGAEVQQTVDGGGCVPAMKSLLDTRPIFHKRDGTIRGRVSETNVRAAESTGAGSMTRETISRSP